MTSHRRRTASSPERSADRRAALPLGYAGRSALGLGKRIGGAPAEAVLFELLETAGTPEFRRISAAVK